MSWGTKYRINYKTWYADTGCVSLMDAGKGTFDSGTESWFIYGNNTIANVSGALQITYVDDYRGAGEYFSGAGDLTTNLTVGNKYKVFVRAKVNTGSVTISVYQIGGTLLGSIGTCDSTSYTWYSGYFTATNASTNYLRMGDMAAGEIIYIDQWYVMDWNDATEILIKERDYTGSETELTAGPEPLKITLKTDSEDPFFPIRQTSAEIQIVATSDFQFIDFFTSDSKKYQIEVLKNGSTWWMWYLIADQYSEPYEQPSYIVTLYATDGLGWLKNVPYLDAEVVITGKKSIVSFFSAAFGEVLETYLDIWENINIYEDNISPTSSDSVLDQIYYDASGMYSSISEPTYYDVLYNLLRTFNAYVVQSRGAWNIICIPSNYTANYRRLWVWSAPNYAYDNNELHDPVVATTAKDVAKSSLVCLIGNTLSISPGWRRMTANQNYGLISQLIEGGDFPYEDFNTGAGTNANWAKTGVLTIAPIKSAIPVSQTSHTRTNSTTGTSTRTKNPEWYQASNSSHRISRSGARNIYARTYDALFSASSGMSITHDTAIGTAGYVTNTIGDVVTTSDDLLFRIKYGIRYAPASWVVYMEIILTGASTKRCLDETGNWQAAQTYITYGGSSGYNIVEEKEIYAASIPIDGELTVNIYELITASAPTDFIFFQCFCYYLPSGLGCYANKLREIIINNNYSYTPELDAYILGDAPNHDNNSLCYRNNLWYNDGGYIPTSSWFFADAQIGVGWVDSASDELLNQITGEIARQHTLPMQRITGEIISKLAMWDDTIEESFNCDRRFMILRGTWNDKIGKLSDLMLQQIMTRGSLITEWTNVTWETFTVTDALIESAINTVGAAQATSNAITFSLNDRFYLTWSADAHDDDGYFQVGGVMTYITANTGNQVIKPTGAAYQEAYFSMANGATGTFTNITFYLLKY